MLTGARGILMRLSCASLLVLGSAGSARAVPESFVIHFPGVLGLAPTNAFFTYDAQASTFTDFHVLWDEVDFDLTSAANGPFALHPSPSGCPGSPASRTGTGMEKR